MDDFLADSSDDDDAAPEQQQMPEAPAVEPVPSTPVTATAVTSSSDIERFLNADTPLSPETANEATDAPPPPTPDAVAPPEPARPPAEPALPPAEPMLPPAESVLPPAEPVLPPPEPLLPAAEPALPPTESLLPEPATLLPEPAAEAAPPALPPAESLPPEPATPPPEPAAPAPAPATPAAEKKHGRHFTLNAATKPPPAPAAPEAAAPAPAPATPEFSVAPDDDDDDEAEASAAAPATPAKETAMQRMRRMAAEAKLPASMKAPSMNFKAPQLWSGKDAKDTGEAPAPAPARNFGLSSASMKSSMSSAWSYGRKMSEAASKAAATMAKSDPALTPKSPLNTAAPPPPDDVGSPPAPPANCFSIGDDDDDDDELDYAGSPSRAGEERKAPAEPSPPKPKPAAPPPLSAEDAAVLALAQHRIAGLQKGEEVTFDSSCLPDTILFMCFKLKPNKAAGVFGRNALTEEKLLRCIGVNRERLLVFDTRGRRIELGGKGVVKSNHHLTELVKLTFPRAREQDVVALHIRAGQAGDDLALKANVYKVPRAQSLITRLQERLERFR